MTVTLFDEVIGTPVNADHALDPAADTVILPALSSIRFFSTPNQTDASA